jgi:hypothetical protein
VLERNNLSDSLTLLTHFNLLSTIVCSDSFNILAPGPEDCLLYDEYSKARGVGKSSIGLKRDEMLPINGTSARISQCETLGVNQLLPAYQSIFNEGSGVFFANMG